MIPIRHSWLALLFVLTACSTTSTPARFYTLAQPATSAAAVGTTPLFVEILPVRVPERLARPQIVVRNAGTDSAEVRILEQDRWSSHFNDELQDALAGAITSRLGAVDGSRGVRPVDAHSYRIAIELTQFDAVPDHRLQTSFSWSVQRSDTDAATVCRTVLAQPIQDGVGGVVQGMRQAVAEVAEHTSAAVSALESGGEASCGS